MRAFGTLMLPGDSGYLPASAPANGRYLTVRPLAVARVADEDDIVTCVLWCTENGIRPVPRGGGHSYAGFSTTEGLLIDLRRLNRVEIDKRSGLAVAGGSALNGDYLVATENGPLFLPGGTCLGVGIGGLTLGGGIGYNAHWAGLTCDHMQASRIVTADGELREVSPESEPDLYWACRGGAGGIFGINTSFTFDLVEAPIDPIAYYWFEWTGAEAAASVLAAYDALIQTAPDAFNGVAMAEALPLDGESPEAAIGVMSRGQYIGPISELRDIVAPLLEAATPSSQVIEEKSFWAMQRMIATEEPAPHSFGDISRYSNRQLPEATIAHMVDLLVDCPHRSDGANGSLWSLGWVGGVVGQVDRTATAYVHRDATTLLRPTTVWPNDAPASVANDLNAWTSSVIDVLAPHTPAESYQNFPNRALEDWPQQVLRRELGPARGHQDGLRPGQPVHQPTGHPTAIARAETQRAGSQESDSSQSVLPT